MRLDLWEDFQCSYCAIFSQVVEPTIIRSYVIQGTAELVFHDDAFIGSGKTPDESIAAAVASRCAGDEGQFWPYMQYLFANQGPSENDGTFRRPLFDAIAQRSGLKLDAFDSCLSDPAEVRAVSEETIQAAMLGFPGTPAVYVNSELTSNPLDPTELDAEIDAFARGRPTPTPSPSVTPARLRFP